MVSSFKAFRIAVAILFAAAALFASPVWADQNSAQTAINSAQTSLKSCYEAVKQAQSAGANVDPLLATLNDAAESLSEAQLAYASNDYNSAYTYAILSQSQLNGVISQASALQANAENADNQNFRIAVLSIAATIVVLSVGIGFWGTLNRKDRKT